MELPDEIADEEKLARIIFAPSMLEDGNVAPSAFNLDVLKNGTLEDYVSVDRMSFRIPQKEYYSFPPRNPNDHIEGYAWLLSGEARGVKVGAISVDTSPHPSRRNRFHAGISYSEESKLIKGHCESIHFLAITTVLAKKCVYVPF